MDLIHHAQIKHRQFHNPSEVQLCTLLSIKTGGCTENCSYCSQSQSHVETDVQAQKMVGLDEVMAKAREAKRHGSTRFCMGAAFREMKGRKSALKRIGEMTCVTLGMIDEEQAKTLKENGLTAYNHNIDTSREHYPNVITTRTYDDACTGGILGLGETTEDHVGFLHTLSNMSPHPESLPINRLVPIKGTPILQFDSILRTIATARLIMPGSIIRLAAGDKAMLEKWGMKPMESSVSKK
ncbi:Biotin synthase, mitochondrial [Candida viswanathii]|uniref:Biotin synthase, mitochondrial n=1 Tax=Candida viswanathii TaxID=5486 RepID=A0A367XV20_9ASCO|nr:Biotin synthase, mitochondrial [Candida viswanathii]